MSLSWSFPHWSVGHRAMCLHSIFAHAQPWPCLVEASSFGSLHFLLPLLSLKLCGLSIDLDAWSRSYHCDSSTCFFLFCFLTSLNSCRVVRVQALKYCLALLNFFYWPFWCFYFFPFLSRLARHSRFSIPLSFSALHAQPRIMGMLSELLYNSLNKKTWHQIKWAEISFFFTRSIFHGFNLNIYTCMCKVQQSFLLCPALVK